MSLIQHWFTLFLVGFLSSQLCLAYIPRFQNTTQVHLGKRQAFSTQGYQGKDCRVVLFIDKFYLSSFPQQSWPAALQEVYGLMRDVDYLSRYYFDMGMPLVDIRYVDERNDGGVGLGLPSANIDIVLDKLSKGVQSGRDVFSGLSESNLCLIHLITYQDYGRTLGSAYVGQPQGKGGVCDAYGMNTGVTNVMFNKARGSLDLIRQSIRHEFMHGLGAPHDNNVPAGSDGPGNLPECNPSTDQFIMSEIILGGANQDKLSRCSIDMINRVLPLRTGCLVDRGTVSFNQYGPWAYAMTMDGEDKRIPAKAVKGRRVVQPKNQTIYLPPKMVRSASTRASLSAPAAAPATQQKSTGPKPPLIASPPSINAPDSSKWFN